MFLLFVYLLSAFSSFSIFLLLPYLNTFHLFLIRNFLRCNQPHGPMNKNQIEHELGHVEEETHGNPRSQNSELDPVDRSFAQNPI